MLKKYFPILLIFIATTSFAADKFSYTYIGVNLGSANIDDDELYDETGIKGMGYASISGSVGFNDTVALSLSSSAYSKNSDGIELTYSFSQFLLSFPFSINTNISIIPFLGARSDEIKVCSSYFCYIDDESSMAYGMEIRAWLSPGVVEIFSSYLSANSEGFSSEIMIGSAYWLNENSSVNLMFSADDYVSVFSIGYRYSWQ